MHLFASLACYTRAVFQTLAAQLLIHLPAKVLGEAVDGGSNTWTIVSHVTQPDEIPGSWL